MPASTLHCPGCGAPAAADAARCVYCDSALATVTCGACFAPMFKGSRFCAQCGAEAKRDVLEDAPELNCPRCHANMQALKLANVQASECSECGGLWLDPATLQKLSAERELHGAVIATLAARTPSSTLTAAAVTYLPCPVCARLMNRTNFGKSSGVIIDVCKKDGAWLDRGELQRVLGFVEGGGLIRQVEREKEALADERRRLAAVAAATKDYSLPVTPGIVLSHHRHRNQSDALDHVLFDIVSLFHS
jgi:Zn-finger nucleic acid-binding protein